MMKSGMGQAALPDTYGAVLCLGDPRSLTPGTPAAETPAAA
jgi:hypothetical protein